MPSCSGRAGADRRFVDNERFSSLRRPGWLLSLFDMAGREGGDRWRSHAGHHEIQQKGRDEVFRDYHLRVGEILLDSQLPAGQGLPERRLDETATTAKLIDLREAAPDDLSSEPDPSAVAAQLGVPDPAAIRGLSTGTCSKASIAREVHSPHFHA